jgi:putative uncharacterized protein ORF16
MALLLAFLIGIAGLVVASPVARAAEVDAIDRGSIRISKRDANEAALYLWSGVRIDANWRIPDQSGKAGDTFKLALPKELEGSTGSFDLKGSEGDPLTYGTCEVSKSEVVCTFNKNVEGKNNVGGSLWVSSQVVTLIKTSKVTFRLGGGAIEVPLPNGQREVGYGPYLPTQINKSGWFIADDPSVIHWRIVVPGAKVADRSRMVITDNYAVAGTNLTVVKGNPSVYWVPNEVKCWNESYTAQCHTKLNGSTSPSLKVTVDDTKDVITATIDNKGKNFESNRLYVFDLRVKADGPIPAGAQFTNKATIDAEQRTASTTKSVSGGGTGSGDAVGHIAVKKAVVGGQVAADTTYPVAWSYQYKGQTRSGELTLKADGTPETLNNVPNGTVVTLTEKVPAGGDIDYGDPVFLGEGVKDGAPDAASAQVTVKGLKTVEVALTNHVNPRLAAVEVTPGVCKPGSLEPSDPTVKVGETDGITYSAPKFTTSGGKVTVEVTAAPAAGKEIDDQHLPEGWKANGDGSFTFTTTVDQPDCVKTVTPVIPAIGEQACPVDSTTPVPPSVTGIEDTKEIDYSDPKITRDGGKVTITVTATAKDGYRIDTDKLPEGWSVVNGVITYSKTITQLACDLPVSPTIDPGVCTLGSTTPSQPSVMVADTPGITYGEPEIKVVDGTVHVTVTATAQDGHEFAGPMPEGWKRVDAKTAVFTGEAKTPVCEVPAAPTPAPTPSPSATPTPEPSPTPSATPTPSRPLPAPVKPGLPKTGS